MPLFVDSFDIKLSVASKNSCKSDTTIISAINVINNPIADFNANKFISKYSEPEITFSNLSTHLPQQNLATNSTELEPSTSLPLNGQVLLMQSSAKADDNDSETTPANAKTYLSKVFIIIWF